MNNINTRICNALESLSMPIAENHISKEYLNKKGETEYIVFNVVSEIPDISADDKVETERTYIYVNLFTRENPQIYKHMLVALLRNAEFGVTDSQILYESDTGYNHIVIECETAT